MKQTKRILSVVLCLLMLVAVVPVGMVTVSAASYGAITLNVPWYSMRHVSGCGISSIAMIEGYVKGYGDNDSTCYNAVYNYNAKKNSNPVFLGSYAYLGYETRTNTLASVYNELKKGNPVLIYRTGSDHFSVIYGYNGSTTTLQKSGFRVKDTSHNENYSAFSWSVAKEKGYDTNLEKWLDGSTWKHTLVRTANKIPLADKKQTVSVTFNGNGGSPSASSVKFVIGEEYGGALPSALRVGYSFDGWYTSATGGTRQYVSDKVSSSVKTLYAHWSKNSTGVLQIGHIYKIYNKYSALPMQTNGENAGSYVCQSTEDPTSKQLWRVTYADNNGYYKFESLHGCNALDMEDNPRFGYHNHLQVNTPSNSDSQMFSFVKREDKAGGSGYYSMHCKNSGLLVDVQGASKDPGANLQQWSPHFGAAQLFYFVEITDREVQFFDNLNDNYLASPREVYNSIDSTIPKDHYSSRDTSCVTVTINPIEDSLLIKQIKAGSLGVGEMKWVSTINGSYAFDNHELNDSTVTLHFKAKASVSGAKMYFRWGYEKTLYSVTLTTSWADYTLNLPRSKRSGNNLHPFIDKVCTVDMKEISMYENGESGYIGDTDTFSAVRVVGNVYDTQSCKTPLPTKTKEGYLFDGWYTKRIGGTKVAGGNDYYDVSSLSGSTYLYAHWVKNIVHTHSYIGTLKAPTCTEQGYTTHVCTTCGDSYSDNYVNALGHDYKAAVREATCTQAGYTTYTCTVCGDTYIGNEKEALGHNYVGETTVATCIKDGKTVFTCSRCSDSYSEIETAIGHVDEDDNGICEYCSAVLPTHKHTYEETTTRQPNCTQAGEKRFTCSACSDSYTSPIPALGHTDADSNGNCTRCGTHIKDVTPSQPSNPQPNPNACKYCGQVHTGLFGWLIKFFHSILAIFKR